METKRRINGIQNSSYIALVEKIYREKNKPQQYSGSIESMLREFFSKMSKKRHAWKRETFKNMLIHLYNEGCYAMLKNYNYVAVLYNISTLGNVFVRPFENWKPESRFETEQISTLIRHCFAKYETPEFLESAFYSGDQKAMLWYVRLGRGESVKNLAGLPIKLTDRMAHEFRNAPSFLSINEALRYAQARGFNASTKTAKMIAFSRLANIDEAHETFWATVVQFFAKEADLNVNDVDSMIDYISYKYRQNESFSMKHRTLKALKTQSDEWHRHVFLKEKGEFTTWESTGIEPLYTEETVEDKNIVYRTVELLDSNALYEEGHEMHHCVSEYDEECMDGTSSIFSLRCYEEGEPVKRLATLEVELPENMLVQAKAKYNQDPDAKSLELIEKWVKEAKLKTRHEVASERAYQAPQGAHARALERRELRANEDTNATIMILKIVFWLLYFIFRVMMS